MDFAAKGIVMMIPRSRLGALARGLAGGLLVGLMVHPGSRSDDPQVVLDAAEPSTLSGMLIAPWELRELLGQSDVRVLDTRTEAEYVGGHISGAVRVDVGSWQEQGRRDGGFHDALRWSDLVGRLGITRETAVVVYGTQLPDTARVWWTLKYLGLGQVAVLDGGWAAWLEASLPTDTNPPHVEPVAFEPAFQADRLEELDSLKVAVQAGRVTVVDARSPEEFSGEAVRGKRGGHIPGARNLQWTDLLAADGRFKTPEQLRDLFRERGITPEQTAVTC